MSVIAGEVYTYRVRADGEGEAVYATDSATALYPGATLDTPTDVGYHNGNNVLLGWEWDGDPAHPDPLTGIGASANGYDFELRFTRGQNPHGISDGPDFHIDRFFTGSNWLWNDVFAYAPASAGSYLAATSLFAGGDYSVQVRAIHSLGAHSDWSEPVEFEVEGNIPSTPSGVSVIDNLDNTLTISWSDGESSAGHNTYIMGIVGSTGKGVIVGMTAGDQTSYITPNDDYSGFYIVELSDTYGISADSTVVANPLYVSSPYAAVPAAPDHLSATLDNPSGRGAINLLWDNVPNNETKFDGRWSHDNSTWTSIQTNKDVPWHQIEAPGKLGWIFGKTYHFEVSATNASGSSSYDTATLALPRKAPLVCASCGNNAVAFDGNLNTAGLKLHSTIGSHSDGQDVNADANARSGEAVLAQLDGNDSLTIIYSSGDQIYFDLDTLTNKYIGDFGITDTLVHSGSEFILTDGYGRQTRFSDTFSNEPSGAISRMKEERDPGGNRTRVTSVNGDGKRTEVRITDTDNVDRESWLYTYFTSGAAEGEIQTITQRIKNGGGWTTIRILDYTYYDGTTDHGLAGQMRTATLTDGSANVLEEYYYRYYADDEEGGAAGDLKFSFGDESYKRLLEAYSETDADGLTDLELKPYADTYSEYDASGRIVARTVQGAGCSTCTGGQGGYEYAYSFSDHADGFNSWHSKRVETLPDGNQNITYYNSVGQLMLEVFKNVTTSQMWGTFHVFDSAGREIMTASPSAVALPGSLSTIEAYADLLHNVSGDYDYLHDSTGLIQITEYYSSTTATESSAGGVAGYWQNQKIKQGDTGTAILQSSVEYIAHDNDTDDADDTLGGGAGDDITIYPIASQTQYRETNGTGGQTTSFSYTWFTDSLQAESKTTTNPIVTTAQNGSNSATSSVNVYDTFGRLIWQKDEDGYIHYKEYHGVTGGLTRQITDVNTAIVGNEPSGWTTPGGGGLHLSTDYVVDDLGRTTKMTDPNGNVTYSVYDDETLETRVYRGWNATTGLPTGPIEVSRYDRARGYSERLTMSATPSTSGSSGSYVPTGGESIANVQSLSRDILNASGQVVERVVYTDLTGATYSQSTVKFGTVGANYDLTEIGYDDRGRQARVKNANGTWTHTVYDGLGRAVSTWVGTNNTGWTQTDPTGASTSGNNMVKVSESEYDEGGVGDGNLTESTAIPGAGATNRVSAYYYDWRNRMVAAKSGVQVSESTGVQRQISYTDYDNLSQAIASYVYDGDNVTLTSTSGVPNKPSSSLLRAKSTTGYNELGRPYRSTTFSVDPTDGTVSSTGLVSNTWFDNRGQVIKTSVPEQPIAKMRYDGAGRVTKQFAVSSWDDKVYGDVDDVSGDFVQEQTEYLYDANGNVIQTAVRQRFHDTFFAGELGNPSSGGSTAKARVSYTGSYYDKSNRLIESINVGTNGGSSWTRPADSLIPARADDVLRTSYSYDAAGRLQDVTDPKAIVARTEYDLAGRTARTIEAYSNGVPTASSNRITGYTYDGLGNIATIKAVLPDGPDVGSDYDVQETKYLYGATTARGDGLNSNDVLIAVRYPDKSTGLASSGEEEVFTTSALGQTIEKEDRNGTVHTFSYDVIGRPLRDAVTTLGSNVDDAILRIETTYDTQGLVEKITSYDDDVAGDVVNEIQREYNGFGQLTTEWQAHDGTVNTGSTPKVQYVYSEMKPSTGYANWAEGMASLASLPESFEWNGVTFTRQIDSNDWRGYAGEMTYEWSNWIGSDSFDTYYHRFHFGAYDSENYRIINGAMGSSEWEVWNDEIYGTDPTPIGFVDVNGIPTIPAYLSTVNHSRLIGVIYPNGRTVGYSYEGLGNNTISRLHSVISDGRAYYGQGSEVYSYLGLGTVVERDRTYFQGMSLTYIGTPADAGDQYSGLDRFGRIVDQNWVNESSTPFDRHTYTYDRNSNRISKTNEFEASLSETYTYDNLNRLTATTRNSIANQSWSLDALGNSNSVTTAGVPESRTHNSQNQLTTKGSDSLAFDDNGNTTTDQNGLTLVYDAWNRLVEILDGVSTEIRYEYDGMTRRIEEADADQYFNANWQVVEEQVSGETTISNVWSAVYVDALIVRDRNTVGDDSVLEEQLSFLQDPNFNVIALVDSTERIIERYIYDAYGKRTVLDDDWLADSDGLSDVDNRQGHQGGFYDRVVENQILFRNRVYDVETTRWLQQDPLGYVDSLNHFEAERSRPITLLDPRGTCAQLANTPLIPCSEMDCTWTVKISGWSVGAVLMTGNISVEAQGVDTTNCIYGFEAGGWKVLAGAQWGLGHYTVSGDTTITIKGPCKWPVKLGSSASIGWVGAAIELDPMIISGINLNLAVFSAGAFNFKDGPFNVDGVVNFHFAGGGVEVKIHRWTKVPTRVPPMMFEPNP